MTTSYIPITNKSSLTRFTWSLGFRNWDFSGVVFLPTVLMMSGLIIVIAATLSLVVYLLVGGVYGVRLGAEALAAARAGVADGVLRLLRDNLFTSGGYDVAVAAGKVRVTVTLTAAAADYDTKEIIAGGCSFNRYRQVRAVVLLNKNTGQLTVASIGEEPVSQSLAVCP